MKIQWKMFYNSFRNFFPLLIIPFQPLHISFFFVKRSFESQNISHRISHGFKNNEHKKYRRMLKWKIIKMWIQIIFPNERSVKLVSCLLISLICTSTHSSRLLCSCTVETAPFIVEFVCKLMLNRLQENIFKKCFLLSRFTVSLLSSSTRAWNRFHISYFCCQLMRRNY